jgi:hypothetical protein
MATVLEEYTTEELRLVVGFLWAEEHNAKDLIKKYFLSIVGSVCRVKRFKTGGKCFADDEKVETEIRMWPRQ